MLLRYDYLKTKIYFHRLKLSSQKSVGFAPESVTLNFTIGGNWKSVIFVIALAKILKKKNTDTENNIETFCNDYITNFLYFNNLFFSLNFLFPQWALLISKKCLRKGVFLTKKANFRVTSGNGIVTPIFYKCI